MSEREPDGQILVEQRGHVLLIGVDRVEKRNGFTPKMFHDLGAAYTQLEKDPDTYVGLLYAKGDHFSAGIDMPRMLPVRTSGQPFVPLNLVDPANLRPPFRKKPVVVALQVHCGEMSVVPERPPDAVHPDYERVHRIWGGRGKRASEGCAECRVNVTQAAWLISAFSSS